MRQHVDESVAVDETLIVLARVALKGNMSRLFAAVNVSDDVAVDQFEVRGRVGGEEVTLASAGSDFTTPVFPILGASGDLVAQAANTTGWFFADVEGLDEVSLWAACAAGGPSTIRVRANTNESETAG